MSIHARIATMVCIAALLAPLTACREQAPLAASKAAAALDAQIDWSGARLIAVQHGNRYKTLDSLARESFSDMSGSEHLPGLSPMASLLDWVFRRDAYEDAPVVRVKEVGLRVRLIEHMNDADRQRHIESKFFTLREINDPRVQEKLRATESRPLLRRAAGRAQHARSIAMFLDRMLRIVPPPSGDRIATWYTPTEVLANLSDAQLAQLGLSRATLPPEAEQPVPGLSSAQAYSVVVPWLALKAAWLGGDAAGVQRYLDRLTAVLPTLASAGVYPSESQRAAEARYYALGKFTWGWALYFLALLFSIPALVTRWRVPWIATLVLLLPAMGFHAYGLALRWYILGFIPVTNMFEAVVFSALLGITIAVVVDLFYGTRVLLVGACATGFVSLLLAQYLLPGGELGAIRSILDHIQLRLHTVLIIAAYAMIFLAAVVAVIYLIGYYSLRFGLQRAAANVAGEQDSVAVEYAVSRRRPLLAGAAPGDEVGANALPQWLNDIDWTHLIMLNMVFVMLFVGGVVLGAMWANDSWGRPWGWDPKETFALNTWIIYAILLHIRFVVRNRGIWTAWLSLAGCLVMAFNWYYVNFYINSVHSYA